MKTVFQNNKLQKWFKTEIGEPEAHILTPAKNIT